MLHNTARTKQWTTKWPYSSNAVFPIVKVIVNKSFVCFRGADRPLLDPPLTSATSYNRDATITLFLIAQQ